MDLTGQVDNFGVLGLIEMENWFEISRFGLVGRKEDLN